MNIEITDITYYISHITLFKNVEVEAKSFLF